MSQKKFCIGPAFALFANKLISRNFNVCEEDRIDLMVAINRNNRLDLNARGVHIYEQERYALLFLLGGFGSHKTENPVCVLSKRGPSLSAVNDVMIAFEDSLSL